MKYIIDTDYRSDLPLIIKAIKPQINKYIEQQPYIYQYRTDLSIPINFI